MLGKSHMVVTASIVATGCLVTGQTFEKSLLYTGVATIASLLPDIDEPKSIIGKKLPRLSKLINKGGHRNFTHTLWIPLALLILWLFAPSFIQPVIMGIFLGYTLHLIEDSFSVRGILWLYPLTQWETNKTTGMPYKKGHHLYKAYYRTGSKKESIIRTVALFVLIIVSLILIKNGIASLYYTYKS